MKKYYSSPELEIEKFMVSSVILTSDNPDSGLGDNGEEVTLPDEF
ncbi:MAG: hypothetical protein ACI4IH_05900 [Eubacterium sp.]